MNSVRGSVPGYGPTILVVDDDDDIRLMTSECLMIKFMWARVPKPAQLLEGSLGWSEAEPQDDERSET